MSCIKETQTNTERVDLFCICKMEETTGYATTVWMEIQLYRNIKEKEIIAIMQQLKEVQFEPGKNSGPRRDSIPWPLQIRCKRSFIHWACYKARRAFLKTREDILDPKAIFKIQFLVNGYFEVFSPQTSSLLIF